VSIRSSNCWPQGRVPRQPVTRGESARMKAFLERRAEGQREVDEARRAAGVGGKKSRVRTS